MVCCSTQKSLKWGVCSLRGSFDLHNGSGGPWGPTGCIDKVLTDVHKKIGIFDVRIRIAQKMVSYSTQKLSKWGVFSLRGSFDLQNGSNGLWGQTVCINKVLTDVHKKNGIFIVGIRITQKMVSYSTQNSLKWGVCLLWGLFDLLNGLDGPWGKTVYIDKVLTDIHKKISIFDFRIQITQKSSKWGVCSLWGLFDLQNG